MNAVLFLWIALLFFPGALFAEEPAIPSRTLDSAEAPPFVGLVTGDRVNLRAGPGTIYEVLTQLFKQQKVEVLEQEGPWLAVRLPKGTPVFVSRHFLEVEENGLGVVTADSVLIRAGPGRSSSPLNKLQRGDRVHVQRLVSDWAQILPPPSCKGWVRSDYIAFLERGGRTAGGEE